MSAIDFLKLLEQQQLVTPKVIAQLRKQISSSDKSVSARSLAKFLVKNQLLTEHQAKSLLEAARKASEAKVIRDDEEELGLADDPDDMPPRSSTWSSKTAPSTEPIEPMDELEVEPLEPAVGNHVDWHAGDHEMDEVEPAHDVMLDEHHADDSAPTAVRKSKRGFGAWLPFPKRGSQPRKKFVPNRWDSPLMLVGGGALLLMVFALLGLWFYLTRGTGDDKYNLAYEQYRNQSYGNAISGFQEFINEYPDHPKLGLAKVRIAVAKIRDRVERRDWDEALSAVQTELPLVKNELDFEVARDELASLLPEIMEGFADQAMQADAVEQAQERLGQAEATLQEVQNSEYIPSSRYRGQQAQIEGTLAKLEGVRRRINRDEELDRTIEEINTRVTAGEIRQAYQLRQDLLTKYPSLETDPRLAEVVATITLRERESIVPTNDLPLPDADDGATAAQYQVVIGNRRPPGDSSGADVVIVQTRGAVFGLRGDNGQLLWRRFVGARGEIQPLRVSADPKADVLVVDDRTNSLFRLRGETGETVWRLPCPLPLEQPVVEGNQLVVAAGDDSGGLLMEVDIESGSVLRGVQIPVGISGAPGVDRERAAVIQPAAHSSVYVINAESGTCVDVIYVGHGAHSIVVPPIAVAGLTIVAENPAPDFALLHVFGTDPEHPERQRALIEPIRLSGRVLQPMVTFGRRVLVATDRGLLQVLELDPGNSITPVRLTAATTSSVPPGVVSYPLLVEGRLWVGDSQLTSYELQISRGQFVRKWINSKGDLFVSPLQYHHGLVITARRQSERDGVTIGAFQGTDASRGAREGEVVWQTELAVPPAGEPVIDRTRQEIAVVNANGALFTIGREEIRRGVVDQARAELIDSRSPRLNRSRVVDESRSVFFGERAGHEPIVVTLGDTSPLRPLELSLDGDVPVAQPVLFENRLLVPCNGGRVHLIDIEKGVSVAHPFQASAPPGVELNWFSPAVERDAQSAILLDQNGNLTRIGLKADPSPHLAMQGQAALGKTPVTGPVSLPQAIVATTQDVGHDQLLVLSPSDLSIVAEVPLRGRLAWGPYPLTDFVLVGADPGQIVAVDQNGTQRFEVSISEDVPIGPPLLIDDSILVSLVSGIVLQLDAATGAERSRVVVGEPIGTGPVQFSGSRFLVAGADSTVFVINFPEFE